MNDKVVIGLLSTIVAGWTAGFIAKALGKGSAAATIDLITNLLCFTTAVGTVATAVSAFRKLIGGF